MEKAVRSILIGLTACVLFFGVFYVWENFSEVDNFFAKLSFGVYKLNFVIVKKSAAPASVLNGVLDNFEKYGIIK